MTTDKKSFLSKVSNVKELILALTGLLIAVASFVKPQSNKVTQNAYEELSKDIVEISSATRRNHDDLTALRGYVDGLRANVIVSDPSSFKMSPSPLYNSKPPMPPFLSGKPVAMNPAPFEQVKSKK